MSEDKLGRDTLAEACEAVQYMEKDSTKTRELLAEVVQALEPYLQRAGIQYGGETWTEEGTPRDFTCRIATKKFCDGRSLVVQAWRT